MVNLEEHLVHWNGRSPVWVLLCAVRKGCKAQGWTYNTIMFPVIHFDEGSVGMFKWRL